MKSIGFATQKGGVGKTTTAVNVCHGLSRKGYNVVLVDCDRQGNAGKILLGEEQEIHNELAEVLIGERVIAEAVLMVRDNFFLLPTRAGSKKLKTFLENQTTEFPYAFDGLKEALSQTGFDFVVFDMAPAFGTMESMIVAACDEVIPPLIPEYLSMDGIRQFNENVEETRLRRRSNVLFSKIVVNLTNMGEKGHREITAAIREQADAGGFDFFQVPKDSRIKDGQVEQKTAYEVGQEKSIDAYDTLVEAIA